ncbi:S8 family peptidase [Mycolicibacter engbaekii]|uniref:S8 family peptidase n=1 Tax=Mycolicibacter engbaekii TaxID=188915 RepID=UPI000A167AD3|nr:S8 family peptidase [Mycolicibacter engbaekii]
MTNPTGDGFPQRRLLHGGEALRIEVTPARGGGGDKFEPQTAEQARELLLPQVTEVAQRAHSLPAQLRAPDRVYLEAKLLPNYIAATYFPTELLNQIGAIPVGSRAAVGQYQTATRTTRQGTRRIVFTVPDAGVDSLLNLIQTGGQIGQARSQLQAFQEIRMFDEIGLPATEEVLRLPDNAIEDELESDELTWEAVLHPFTVSSTGAIVPAGATTLDRWFDLIESVGGQIYHDFVSKVSGLTFVPLRAPASAALRLSEFNPLRALHPMPTLSPRPQQIGLRQLVQTQPPATSAPVTDTVRVAVFDGGVDTSGGPSELFAIPTVDLTTAPPLPRDLAHGTGVAGAVLYGLLVPGQTAPQPPLPVESFRILPPPPNVPADLAGYWVLDRIVETVSTGNYQIVNLSLGVDSAVEDGTEPNRWTSELDNLAWETDALFIVAAGNNGLEDHATGLDRIQVPADMANGLAIGSCDTATPTTPWGRAPYSAIGPGRQGNVIQPVGVQFGGDSRTPFEVLRADGTHWQSAGTSYAAPVATHALADLASRLPRVNSSVLRAFTVHFAERHRHYKSRQNELGHGRLPTQYADILDCGPDEVHVLFIDSITRGELVGYQLPAPVSDGRLSLHVTLAYASPVDPTQPTEYTNASLDLTLRPHHLNYKLYPPKDRPEAGKPQTLSLASEEARELLAQGWRFGDHPVTMTLPGYKGKSEHRLRDSGKWETLRHHRLTLPAGSVSEPRIEIGYVARKAGALDSAPTEVPFALLITLRDKNSSGTLYDQIAARYRVLQPVPRIRVRQQINGQRAHWS